MKLIYLGGALEVGASSILINIEGKNILLDSGIRQGGIKDKLPNFSTISNYGNLDAIIISHAHMDHIGSLPIISKEYPSALIYMTTMTLDLMKVLLYDSLKIMNYNEGEIPLFKEEDVLAMLNRVRVIPFEKETEILNNIKLTFYMAGHIAGAAVSYIKTKSGTILYTGDYSLFNQHAISGLSIPKLRPDVVISEATYGDKLHSSRIVEEAKLIEEINKTINNNGKVLIPAFALGRSQEILLILNKAINKKELRNVPIYVDGMIKNINRVFLNNPLYLSNNIGKRILKGQNVFYQHNVCEVTTKDEREKIVNSSDPCIIIASSGMLTGGMSEYYARYLVTNALNSLILTGYQDEESNGRILLKLLDEEPKDRYLKLNGTVVPVLCNVTKVGLSAHADKQEMKSLFSNLLPKYIILGHGDKEIIPLFAKEITKEISPRVYAPSVCEELDIDIRNPRKQISREITNLYGMNGTMEEFYHFMKNNYGDRLFTKENISYIYYGHVPTEAEIDILTNNLIDSIYFTQDIKRFFMFKINDELSINELLNKSITAQDIESIIRDKFKNYNYKKISYYLSEKRVVLTFDFPKVVDISSVSKDIKDNYDILVEKNDSINNLACENKIKEIIGSNVINKISYLPSIDKFKIKVYEDVNKYKDIIKSTIGYDVDFVIVPKVNNINIIRDNYNINEAFLYIDNYFNSKEDKPYKKSFKNNIIILSFITYEIGYKYIADINNISNTINYKIDINKSPNINMIFNITSELLNKYNIKSVKNPSYLPNINKVNIKIENKNSNIDLFINEFKKLTGLDIIVEYI